MYQQSIYRMISIVFRFVLATLAVALPFVLLGVALFEMKGVWIGLATGSLLVVGIVVFSEDLVVRAFQINPQAIKGLERSLKVTLENSDRLPRLLVFCDPAPDALVLRSLGGRGTILLSQGMIGLLSEDELRAVLKLCVMRTRQPGAILYSLCSVLASLALAIAPRPWVQLVFSGRSLSRLEEYLLSPLSAIGFVILLPTIRFFLRLGNLPLPKGGVSGSHGHLSAMQKVLQTVHVLGAGRSQRAFSLFSLR